MWHSELVGLGQGDPYVVMVVGAQHEQRWEAASVFPVSSLSVS